MTSPVRVPMDFSTDPDALLREADAAEYLRYQPRALQEWRRLGTGPEFVRVSARSVRYRRRDLDAWVAARVRKSTSDDEACWSAPHRAAVVASRARKSTSNASTNT